MSAADESDPESEGTTWAPRQHQGMRCACVHWDARECIRSRGPKLLFFDPDEDLDEWDNGCECCCHDRDDDDDAEFEL